jgi:hypothetical protein
MKKVEAKRENVNDRISSYVKENLGINVGLSREETIDNIKKGAVNFLNRSMTADGVDRIVTSCNYAPYYSHVLLEGIHRVKVIDIVKAKTAGTLQTSVISNVHETGALNPTLIVRGFGYAVKGLNIGDCVDINPEPGCLVRRSAIDIDDDYETIHDRYHFRNPNMAKAVNLDKLSKVVISGGKPQMDLDDPNDVIEIKFAYVIEARFITGIYYNKKTIDRAIKAFDIDSVAGHLTSDACDQEPVKDNSERHPIEKYPVADVGSDHDIDKVKPTIKDLTPAPDYTKGIIIQGK